MRNNFIGWSQEELEKALRKVQEERATGKRITSWGSGDTNVSKTVDGSLDKTQDDIEYALYCLDPNKYPLSSIRRQTVTVGRLESFR